jgi:hypothetical protein
MELTDMTIGDLDALLKKLRVNHEDLMAERKFVLGQTGVHLEAGITHKYEIELANMMTKIGQVEEALRGKGAEVA